MKLEDLGYYEKLENFRIENGLKSFETGRVVAEHKERYIVKTTSGEFEAEITGNLRFSAQSREDFPAVGDWVAITVFDADFAVIHQILPRFSVLKRQAVGHFGDVQIIAANIDFAFLVQAVDRDLNMNRLERYLTICYASGVTPVIILTKTDLIGETQLAEIIEAVKLRISDVLVIAVSNETHEGIDALKCVIEKGKTYCLLGSSGVGKSTLLNSLSGESLMTTSGVSESTGKGRHTTSHRELIVLENGGILIDNPGMREVGIADTSGGLETTFDKIFAFSEHCKFNNCTHTTETGCAVLEAVQNGEIEKGAYENYQKMEREKAHFETSVAEKRKKEKIFGKILKDYYKKDIRKK
ncbi:MAG TPA: ribosome small subunit-dependent GTPase A [Prolixibacteraceae bacterium]|nr:ribosome small subunit-dependent GTPase A [Prolixibacteraceae bacterium]